MILSIVSVCFNSEATIRDTIESVLCQTYPEIEYIIIDGASRDRTMAIVDEYRERISTVVSEPDKGIYDAMNKGIALATGDIVGILNSDDFYENSSVIENIANHFKVHPESNMAFGNIVFVKSDNLHRVVRYYSASHFQPWKLRFGWMPPHPATFIRRSVYEKFGLYSLNYKISADYEMFVRLLAVHGLKFSKLNQVLVRMRSGGVSTDGFKSRMILNREIVRACRENGIYTNLLLVLTKTPFKLLELVRKPI